MDNMTRIYPVPGLTILKLLSVLNPDFLHPAVFGNPHWQFCNTNPPPVR